MHNIILRSAMAVVLAAAAHGCTRLTTIGWSAESNGKLDAAISVPRHATTVVASRSELLQPASAGLGDIDGDGLDDFMLMSWPLTDTGGTGAERSDSTAYLFYGRSSFPEFTQLQDADATFVSGSPFNYPLGDINGDGYNDFALSDSSGYEFIFGGPERVSGKHEKLSTGKVVWTYEPQQVGNSPVLTGFDQITKLGDTNGDGYDDFVVRVVEKAPDDGRWWGAWGVIFNDYIVLGRKDNWPSGAWDPRWTVADFGADTDDPSGTSNKLGVIGSGDLDGDGLTDIIAAGWERKWVFYGKSGGFQGTLSSDNADADLHLGSMDWPYVIGDLDDDGRDDLAAFGLNELQVYYSSKQRYAGRVEAQADLTFYDQGPYNNPLVGDFNSDGRPDLIFVGNAETKHWDDWATGPMHLVVNQVDGTGERLTGRHQLTSADVYKPIGYAAPPVLDTGGFNLQVAGDFDGDGSSDIIVGAPGQEDPAESYVLLLPGAARTPD